MDRDSLSALPTTAAGGHFVGNPEEADEALIMVDLAANPGAFVLAAAAMVVMPTARPNAATRAMRVFFMFGPPR